MSSSCPVEERRKQKVPALSVVGTPIGNLSDFSARGRAALESCDCILCEDTRVSLRLLRAIAVTKPLERMDSYATPHKLEAILSRISSGERFALISDAGMPAISDPGQLLIDAVLDQGASVEVVPGPTSFTTALVSSGFASDHFFFEGFLPRRGSERRRRLQLVSAIPATILILESPHRVLDTLRDLEPLCDRRRVAVCRELTKLYEEVIRGSFSQVIEQISARLELKGECVLVLESFSPEAREEQEDRLIAKLNATPDQHLSLDEAIKEGLAQGSPKTAVAKRLSKQFGMARDEVYRRIVELA